MFLLYSWYFMWPAASLYIFAMLELALLLLSFAILDKLVKIRTELLPSGLEPIHAAARTTYAPPQPLDLVDERASAAASADNGTSPLLSLDIPEAGFVERTASAAGAWSL